MKNVLVTGGAGFIGSHIVDLLIARGCDVTVLDNFSFGKREHLNSSVRVVEGDIADRKFVFQAMHPEFDTIVHLAAIHFIPYCNRYPNQACRTNIEGTQNVFDAAIALGGIKRLFTASTAAVYPDCKGPISESTPRAPLDVYGMTKSANEEQAAILALRSSIRVSVGRFFNAVGGRETNPHLVPDILSRIQESNDIQIGNVDPRRDYIDVRDMATAVIAMLEGNNDAFDVCNIGTGNIHNVAEIIDIISQIHGSRITCKVAEHLVRKVERMNLQADPGRLKKRYRWTPSFSTHDSLAYAYDWYVRGNPPGIRGDQK